METADLVLAIAVPLVAMLAGWVGVEMSLIPQELQTPTRRGRYRAAFVLLMATAIGLNIWQTARSANQQNDSRTENLRKQAELTNKVSEQGGKLEAIVQFEQQMLNLLPRFKQSSATAPDAATKAYEAMALAVMRLAQGTPPKEQADDTASKELWALTTTPQIVQQLRERAQDQFTFDSKLQDLSAREWQAETQCRQQHPVDPDCIGRVNKTWQDEKLKADETYSPATMQRLISTADSIRKLLLQQIPPERQNPLDTVEAQKFTAALSKPDSLDKADAASYLENLARRAPPATKPSSLK